MTDRPQGAGEARRLAVEFLYLDLGHCGRCQGTSDVLDEALELTGPMLAALGVSCEVTRTHVTSAEQAAARGFVASPTLLINGEDIQPEAYQNTCRECGELCNCADGVDCRIWVWDGEQTLTPPVALIVNKLIAAATTQKTTGRPPAGLAGEAAHRGSANIERFFAGPEQTDRCCRPGCCA